MQPLRPPLQPTRPRLRASSRTTSSRVALRARRDAESRRGTRAPPGPPFFYVRLPRLTFKELAVYSPVKPPVDSGRSTWEIGPCAYRRTHEPFRFWRQF